MQKWTKAEFIREVNPCGYRFRIWWFFLFHKHVTLLDVVNARGVDDNVKRQLIMLLDHRLYFRGFDEFKKGGKSPFECMRAEILAARK
jgi:hypothetical protein